MEQKHTPNETTNNYFINQELVEEMVRLNRQGRFITEGMGGVLPEQEDLSHVHDILDIACGPGEWAMRAAQEYPDKQVVGVDVSQRMIEYAAVQAEAYDIPAQFRVMDVLKPLDFPDASFDLVNTRTILAFMTPQRWHDLLLECMRVLRPGGVIRITEHETVITNNLAWEELIALCSQAFKVAGYTSSPDGRHCGVTIVLKQMLRQAGYINPQHRVHAIDFSAGTPAHDSVFEDWLLGVRLSIPFFLKTGLRDREEINELRERIAEAEKLEDFCGYWFLMTVWAQKSQ